MFWAHFWIFVIFFVSHTVSTIEAGLIALEDGLIAAAIHVLAKKGLAGLGPRQVCLAGHDLFIWHWVKSRGTIKVTLKYRLEESKTWHNFVDAG